MGCKSHNNSKPYANKVPYRRVAVEEECRHPYCKQYPRIAREAGIQGTELLSEQRGGETEPTTYEKERWELIKTHTERRTFISLLKLREWDSIKIKKFSGHKDIAMIDHYCKLEPSDYTDFQRLKRQHPEQVLQFTEDYRTDEPTNTPNPHKYCKYGLMTKKWTR